MHPQLITESDASLLDMIRSELRTASQVMIASAFFTRGALNLVRDPFREFLRKPHARIQFLTSVMNHFNNPADLLYLRESVPGLELRVFWPPDEEGEYRAENIPPFHVKSFIFFKPDGRHSLIVGSSNLTAGGIRNNCEWNYFSNAEVNTPFEGISPLNKAVITFEHYWQDMSREADSAFLSEYTPLWQARQDARNRLADFERDGGLHVPAAPVPRQSQQEILRTLAAKRSAGVDKTAVIAATGLGKTLLAAFDFKQSGLKNVLFIAHRETILRHALTAYRAVLADQSFGYLWAGSASFNAPGPSDSCFAMVQTLSRKDNLTRYTPDYFDYIVIDEFHHAEADSYRRVLDHFRPRFLLGLTATPERMDGRDVLKACGYDISGEVRLFEAIEKNWLVPFQYYAIYDETDYSQIRWTFRGYSEEDLDRILIQDTRADLIISNFKRYLPSCGKMKALAFCSSVNHAVFMHRKFTGAGIESLCLTGASSDAERSDAMRYLADDRHPLQCIFSVDIFGEGVDIPSVTHVLMLRPTESFTVFLQQLGRGLRRMEGKEYLVAMDFVGNFRNSYVAPLALRGCYTVPGDINEIRLVIEGKPPAGCHISADTEVERVWDGEIRRLISTFDRKERLKSVYWEIRAGITGHAPGLMDFFANPASHDPKVFIREYGSWLETRKAMDDLDAAAEKLLKSHAAELLKHLESDLSPQKSYKMYTLKAALELTGAEWKLEGLAARFLSYYLKKPEHIADWDDLAREENPSQYPLKKVISHLVKNPLKYLSDKPDCYFELDTAAGLFRIKAEYAADWLDADFREQAADRLDYALARYFYEKDKRERPKQKKPGMTPEGRFRHYINKSSFVDGFAVSRDAEDWIGAPAEKGNSGLLTFQFEQNRCPVRLTRLNNATGVVQVRYMPESRPLKEWISRIFHRDRVDRNTEYFELEKKPDGVFLIHAYPDKNP